MKIRGTTLTGSFAVLIALGLCCTIGCGSKNKPDGYNYKQKITAPDKPRKLFYSIDESIPPRDNYLRDVFDSAQAISYVNQTVRKAISRRGFTPYDYDLVASKREFDPDALFLEIEITIDFKGSDPVYEVGADADIDLYEYKDGPKIFDGGDSLDVTAKRNYSAAIRKAVNGALKDLIKIPRYRGY